MNDAERFEFIAKNVYGINYGLERTSLRFIAKDGDTVDVSIKTDMDSDDVEVLRKLVDKAKKAYEKSK